MERIGCNQGNDNNTRFIILLWKAALILLPTGDTLDRSEES